MITIKQKIIEKNSTSLYHIFNLLHIIFAKQSTNIKYDEINMLDIIKDNTFNLHNSLLNNDNRYMKVTLKFKIIGVVLWPRKGSLMKTQMRILDNRLYYTRKTELHRKGKKSRTVQVTLILICLLAAKSLVLITVRRIHYGKMGKAPTTSCQVANFGYHEF